MSIDPLSLRRSSSPIDLHENKNPLAASVAKASPQKAREVEIPVDVLREIFHYLEGKELAQGSMTCHIWKKIIDTHFLLNLKRRGSYEKCVFEKKHWEKYFGDVQKAPPLSKDIVKILESYCPFWREKKVYQTHLLVFIPETVNGKPFTLDLLYKLIRHPKEGGKGTKYRHYKSEVKNELGMRKVKRSYWALMTKGVIPGSRARTYKEQCQMVATHQNYRLPLAIEAATAILTHCIKTEEPFYIDGKLGKQWTYIRCQEKVDQDKWPVTIGGLSSSGLSLEAGTGYDFCGVAVLRGF